MVQYLLIYVSPFLLSGIPWSIHLITQLHCSALWHNPFQSHAYYGFCWLLTVRCYHVGFGITIPTTPVRPHGIKQYSFLVYLPDLHIKITVTFLGFNVLRHLTRLMNLCIRFLFVRLRFRYPFFSSVPHGTNLGSRFWVRRQLRLDGLSPYSIDMPVIQ